MSMSTHVKGIKIKDEKFNEMKQVYDLCVKQNIKIPKEVYDYFGDEVSDDGVIIDIKSKESTDNDYRDFIDVKIEDIPKDVKIIRFVMSY